MCFAITGVLLSGRSSVVYWVVALVMAIQAALFSNFSIFGKHSPKRVAMFWGVRLNPGSFSFSAKESMVC